MMFWEIFAKDDGEVILKCLAAITDDDYIHEMDVRMISGYDIDSYIRTIDKINRNEVLVNEDAEKIFMSVFHVSTFPLYNCESLVNRIGFDFKYLYWFSFYVKFALIEYFSEKNGYLM